MPSDDLQLTVTVCRLRRLDSLWRCSRRRWRPTDSRRCSRPARPCGLAVDSSASTRVSFHGCVAAAAAVFNRDELMSAQAWIEASTKGAVLVFAATEIEEKTLGMGVNPAVAGLLGGMTGGVAQAYATMGMRDPRSAPRRNS